MLAKSITAYEAALTERTQERDILKWARTERSLGMAKFLLGILTEDKGMMLDARQAVEDARKAYGSVNPNYDHAFRTQLELYDGFIDKMK